MNYPNYRLFDCIDHQLKHYPKTNMLSAKENGTWKSYSTADIKQLSDRLAAGLLQLGVSGHDFSVENSDKIAIISNNRPEWVITDIAVQKTGAILTPIYPTTSIPEIEFILNDAAVQYIFVSDELLLDKIKQVQKNVPSLKEIYTFNKISGAAHYSELYNLANDASETHVEKIKQQITNQHVATIIYTSGTTGTPKGVMLTHANIVSNIYFSKASFPFPDAPHTKTLSFLPLNHIFEKMITYLYLFSGIDIYYAESLETIGENLKEVRPDGFTTVPRLLEKVYEKIMSKGNELTGIKRRLFFWSVALGTRYDTKKTLGFWYNLQLSIARKLVFKKWKDALGGNIDFIVTGGAAASEKLLRIFNAAGIPVFEGYGPTENSPVISVNRRNDIALGTVGNPIDGITVKIAEDGEILVKGDSVMKGYYKRPDLTAETVIDGWLYTGDIGVWIEGKYLKITDRKKELFKTSGGKYVAPQVIENKMKECRYIEQILVLGAGEKFVSALIIPSFVTLKEWMNENNEPFTTQEAAITNPAVINLLQKEIDRYNANFNHVEQVKKFALLAKEWAVDTGELTPKLSMKRKVIMEKYKQEIEQIYNCE